MINIDFNYCNLKIADILKYQEKINKIENNEDLPGKEYSGWLDYPGSISKELIVDINKTAKKIVSNNEVLVVCGIGGSYLGAKTVIDALTNNFKSEFKIIYLGTSLSEDEIIEALDYLKDKDFAVNVISKSGTTLETALIFRFLKNLLEKKYGAEARSRIIVTTDEFSGGLRELSIEKEYKTYFIPSDIGGRYSVFTPVGLLPIAASGLDIDEFIKGARLASKDLKEVSIEKNLAYQYALYRYINYINGKSVELFVNYNPKLESLNEWWKQLFGESEGKNGKGLFPASSIFPKDLHSLGQFIQDGSKILFETIISFNKPGNLMVEKIGNNFDGLNYLSSKSVSEINKNIKIGTAKAHFKGSVNNLIIEVDKRDEKGLGYLLYFLMKSCVISSYLLGVNPFDQPGVELYKKEVFEIMNKKQ